MPSTVAQLAVQVTSNTQQAETALLGLTSVMKGVGFEALAMVGIVAGIGAIGAVSIKMAGDFQKGITTLVTGAGEAQSNIKMISNGILQMATDTGTSTQQLISGMFMIESAGYHGAAGLVVLKAAAEGAKVGNADLGTVADAVTTVMKDYSTQNITAAQATNLLIATVANGKTHMEDLAGAISTALPTAAKFGVSLGDVMAAMATMTSHGIAAANAATYLRQMIVSLEAPTTAGAKALLSVGLSAQQVGDDIRNYGLPATLQIISDAIGKTFPKNSEAAKIAFKEIAGGSRQMQGMLALTGSSAKEFAADAAKLGAQVHSTSTAITGWSLVQGTFNQHMDVLKATVEDLMIQLGQKLLPVATQFVGFLTSSMIPGIQHFITMIQGSSKEAQILRPILIVLAVAIAGALVLAFIAWAAAAGAAAVATIAATWPVLAAGAAIALLIAALIWAYKNWGWFRIGVDNAVAGVKLGIVWIGNILGQLGQLGSWIGGHSVPVIKALGTAFTDATAPVRTIIGAIQGLINIIGNLLGMLGQVKNAVGAAFGGVGSALHNAGIPGFAGGGTMPAPGLAVVGEQGPELVQLPGGTQITPLSGGNIISGLPSGMQQVNAAASGVANGQPIQVHIYLDKQKVGMAVAAAIPGAVRNATGARAF